MPGKISRRIARQRLERRARRFLVHSIKWNQNE